MVLECNYSSDLYEYAETKNGHSCTGQIYFTNHMHYFPFCKMEIRICLPAIALYVCQMY